MCVGAWVCVHDEEREMQVREEGREVGNGDASQQTRRGLAEKCVCVREREKRERRADEFIVKVCTVRYSLGVGC